MCFRVIPKFCFIPLSAASAEPSLKTRILMHRRLSLSLFLVRILVGAVSFFVCGETPRARDARSPSPGRRVCDVAMNFHAAPMAATALAPSCLIN